MRPTLALILTLTLTSCGSATHRDRASGPANITRGMTQAEVESHCSDFQEEARETLPDGRLCIQYRDHHWTWAAGFMHAAAHYSFYFRNGIVESWETR